MNNVCTLARAQAGIGLSQTYSVRTFHCPPARMESIAGNTLIQAVADPGFLFPPYGPEPFLNYAAGIGSGQAGDWDQARRSWQPVLRRRQRDFVLLVSRGKALDQLFQSAFAVWYLWMETCRQSRN
jgi:hypothetical protein